MTRPTVSDNCGPVTVTHEDAIVNQTRQPVRGISVPIRVTDVAGN